MADLRSLPPLLLPPPRALTLLGGFLDLRSDPMGLVLRTKDASLGPGHYRLHVGVGGTGPANQITIAAADERAVGHANATLQQLLLQYGQRLPRLVIEDGPAFPTRGVMLDVSRDRVPTNEHLARLASRLASLKGNHLQLYTEHTFAYTKHPEVWTGMSAMTPAEVRRLDERCRGLGVALAANQNCFGHLANWLKHPAYAWLAETHEQYDFYGLRRAGPHSLCPTDPRSIEFVRGLLDELLPCFSTRQVNIGCDETADVGQGRSRDAVAQRGHFDVYMGFVKEVANAAIARDCRPMFWADVALRHPERARDIPRDLLCLVWGYEPHSPMDQWCGTLREAGREFWVCPGTSSWRSITGRTTQRHGNLLAATRAGLAHGASGMLVTDWGDLGHRQVPAISELGLAHGLAMAWNPAGVVDPRALSLHALGDTTLQAATWLERLGDVDQPIRAIAGRRTDNPDRPAPLGNASALFEHLHPCGFQTHMPASAELWSDVVGRLEDLRRTFPSDLRPVLADELAHTLDVADWAARHAVWTRTGRPGESRADLKDRLRAIIADHRRLWLITSRPGGLDASSAWYEKLLAGLDA